MTRIKMHISNVKLPFYPPCEVKYGLQNRVLTGIRAFELLLMVSRDQASQSSTS